MGVQRTDYIVYGWKLPYDIKLASGEELDAVDFWENEELLSMRQGRPGEKYFLITDGMNGNYAVFGRKISSFDEYEGIDFYKVSLEDFNYDSDMLCKYQEIFGEVPSENPSYLIFSQFR